MPGSLSLLASLARAVLRSPAIRICRSSPIARIMSSASSPPAPPSSSSTSSSNSKASGRPVVTEADTLTPAQLKAIQQLQELKREELEEADDGFVNSTTGERGGPKGPEPTRFGDWERKGRVSDF